MRTHIAGLTVIAWLLTGCSSYQAHPVPTSPHIGMANPASVFCIQQGGQLHMVTETQGVRGMCTFPDGHTIDEWALFRQHHPSQH